MPFVKKSRRHVIAKNSGEQREKKLSELEGEYKKYWDARSKLLKQRQMKPKLPLVAQQRLRLQKAPQQKARLLLLQARLSLATTRSSL